MIAGGNAAVMVADMDRAVAFPTRVLGLEILTRSGSDWAEVTTSGRTDRPPPRGPRGRASTPGSISIGLAVFADPDGSASYLCERWNRWRLDRTDALLRDLGGAA